MSSAVPGLLLILLASEQREELIFCPFPSFTGIDVELLSRKRIVRNVFFDLEPLEVLIQSREMPFDRLIFDRIELRLFLPFEFLKIGSGWSGGNLSVGL